MSRCVVLIADDDRNDVAFLRRALSECCADCLVFDVGDGQEALDYLAGAGQYADRRAFPLPTHLFLDIRMPRRDGLDVLRWLRSRGDVGQIAVAVLSGSRLPSDAQQALALGAAYLVKPLEFEPLRDMVAEYIRKRVI